VSVWLDDLSRPLIESGQLAEVVKMGEIVASQPIRPSSLKAIGSGSGYETQVRDLALRGTDIGETLR
jgi:transaldolase